MKHTEIKAFVRKYNSEFAIKGYSKMKKQPLTDEVKRVISKSRAEIQKEWRELSKVEPKKAKAKAKAKAKTRKPAKKQSKEDKKKQEQDKANRKADDAYHSQHKAGAAGDQGRKMAKSVSRTERKSRIQKDTALARRIRGTH